MDKLLCSLLKTDNPFWRRSFKYYYHRLNFNLCYYYLKLLCIIFIFMLYSYILNLLWTKTGTRLGKHNYNTIIKSPFISFFVLKVYYWSFELIQHILCYLELFIYFWWVLFKVYFNPLASNGFPSQLLTYFNRKRNLNGDFS